MRVHVLFFGVLRERLSAEAWFEAAPGSTVHDLRQFYAGQWPELGEVWNASAIAVNQQYAAPSTVLTEGDEVAVLPPVSGGCCPTQARVHLFCESYAD